MCVRSFMCCVYDISPYIQVNRIRLRMALYINKYLGVITRPQIAHMWPKFQHVKLGLAISGGWTKRRLPSIVIEPTDHYTVVDHRSLPASPQYVIVPAK